MSIKYIEQVSIDGKGNSVNRTLFNGYIYRLNYNVSFGDSKSTIVANLASEDGSFSVTKPDVNYSRVYPIKIGSNINVNMFLKRVRKVVEPSSKSLELEFCDTSTKLDTYIVGLYKKHGVKTGRNVIIVGREVHPCDRDFDGDIDDLTEMLDECHPCRSSAKNSARQELVNCEELTKYTIFDVVYNFDDLLEGLRSVGIRVQNVANPNPHYFARHSGRVRDVLKSWCDDIGWSFYWEDEQVKFIDLRNPINVAASVEQFCPNLAAYEEEWSIDNTFATRSISLYERAGTDETYQCEDARYLNLPVYEQGSAGLTTELSITSKIDKVAAGLSLYSKSLRDLYYTYDKYGLRSHTDYKLGKVMPEIGLTIVSTPVTLIGQNTGGGGGLSIGGLEGGSLEPSTGLFAPVGMPLNPDPSQSIAFLESSPPTAKLQEVKAAIMANVYYKMCFELLTEEDQWIVANGLAKDAEDFFFFVGYYDENLDRQHYQEEAQFANEFIGRYHIYVPTKNDPLDSYFFEDRTFRQDTICSQNIVLPDDKIKYEALGTQGGASISFYNMPGESDSGDLETLSTLPFFKWLTLARDSFQAPNAANKQALFKCVVIQKQGELFFPSPQSTQEIDPDDPQEIKNNIQNQKLIAEAEKNSIIRVERKNNSQGEFIPRKVTEGTLNKNLDRTKTFMFIGRKVGRDDYRMVTNNAFNTSNSIGTVFDGKPLYTRYQEDNPNDKGEVFYQYPELKCLTIGNQNNNCFKRSFTTPVGVFTYYEPTYSLYGLVIEKRKSIKRKIEKLQTTFSYGPDVASTVSRLDLNYRNISDDDIRIFSNRNNTCRYNLNTIKALHDRFSDNLDVSQESPSVTKTFTVEGVDINGSPKISDGLLGLSIDLQEDGVRTTYNFGTTVKKPVSEEVLKAQDLSKMYSATYDIPVSPRKNNV